MFLVHYNRCRDLKAVARLLAEQLKGLHMNSDRTKQYIGFNVPPRTIRTVSLGGEVMIWASRGAHSTRERTFVQGFATTAGLARLCTLVTQHSNELELLTYHALRPVEAAPDQSWANQREAWDQHLRAPMPLFVSGRDITMRSDLQQTLRADMMRIMQFVLYEKRWGANTALWPALDRTF